MRNHRFLIHSNGPALWPEHKPLKEVKKLFDTTPPDLFSATYQGNPVQDGGSVFKAEFWKEKNRYRLDNNHYTGVTNTIARWLSFDTALKTNDGNDYTAMVCGELLPDYRMVISSSWYRRLDMPSLLTSIEKEVNYFNRDGKLNAVIIEDKASGTSALQTLRKSSPDWLASKLVGFMPTTDKVTRAKQAAVWCSNDCVLLPEPSGKAEWLFDFIDQVLEFPSTDFDDMVDAFSQLIIYCENVLADGYHARSSI